MSTIQANLVAAGAQLMVVCGMCFLLTVVVLLADAALIAGLHVGARLSLAASLAVAVGANLALVLALAGLQLLVRLGNRAKNRRLEEAANRPEVCVACAACIAAQLN
jgi:hypothetical protein